MNQVCFIYHILFFVFQNIIKGGAIHWTIYGFEMCSIFFLWLITCGVDSYFGLKTLHMVGELRLLSTKFHNLKVGENYRKDLKELVDKHVGLMQAQKILEKVFGYLTIWLAVTCAVSLCTLIYQFTKVFLMKKLQNKKPFQYFIYFFI